MGSKVCMLVSEKVGPWVGGAGASHCLRWDEIPVHCSALRQQHRLTLLSPKQHNLIHETHLSEGRKFRIRGSMMMGRDPSPSQGCRVDDSARCTKFDVNALNQPNLISSHKYGVGTKPGCILDIFAARFIFWALIIDAKP